MNGCVDGDGCTTGGTEVSPCGGSDGFEESGFGVVGFIQLVIDSCRARCMARIGWVWLLIIYRKNRGD